jgi:thioester reductase-like protein
VHGAANVSWSLPLEDARSINVGGTSEVLRPAEAAASRGTLQAFDYLSTVMVAGKRRGLIGEEELDGSAGYWSTYEQSKAEAERLVRSKRGSLPVSVFRLSMVGGAVIPTDRQVELFARGGFWGVVAIPSYITHWLRRARAL